MTLRALLAPLIATLPKPTLAPAPAAALASAASAVAVGVVGGAVLPDRVDGSFHAYDGALPSFSSVEVWDLDHAVDLNVHANLPPRVTVEAPEGAEILAEVRGDTLVVRGTSPGPVTLSVAMPEIERLVLWGDTHARVRAVHSQELAVTLSDSASVEAEGVVAHLELVADANGQARLHALTAEEARVTASGTSQVDVSVGSVLEATVIDNAGVIYRGNPEVHQVVHRGGRVTPAP